MAARVGVVGAGAIGQAVRTQLEAGRISGAVFGGVVASRSAGPQALSELAACCDVIIEAAGVDSVLDCLRASRAAGADLVVCSTGAFARPELHEWLDAPGPGRLILPAGAIGGIDLLRAVTMAGAVRRVRLVTTKHSSAFSMDGAAGERVVFRGSARAAIAAHPKTANVSVTLALATIGLDDTEVEMIADPDATGTRHQVLVDSDLGSYDFEIRNAVAPGSNARTSALTAWSVLVAVSDAVAVRAT